MSYLKALKRKELLSVVSKGWFGGYMARLASQEANPGSQDSVACRHPGSLGSAQNGPRGPLPLTAKVGAACGLSNTVSSSGKMGKKFQNQSSTERVLPKSGTISDLIARMNFSLTPNKVQELEKFGWGIAPHPTLRVTPHGPFVHPMMAQHAMLGRPGFEPAMHPSFHPELSYAHPVFGPHLATPVEGGTCASKSRASSK
jgi:hypothetical protein